MCGPGRRGLGALGDRFAGLKLVLQLNKSVILTAH
jgi:hypothetical protein